MDGVLLKEMHIPHMRQTTCKIAITSHCHRIGVRADPFKGIPISGIPQLTAIYFMIRAGTAPDAVAVFTHIIHIRHLPLHFQPGSLGKTARQVPNDYDIIRSYLLDNRCLVKLFIGAAAYLNAIIL